MSQSRVCLSTNFADSAISSQRVIAPCASSKTRGSRSDLTREEQTTLGDQVANRDAAVGVAQELILTTEVEILTHHLTMDGPRERQWQSSWMCRPRSLNA